MRSKTYDEYKSVMILAGVAPMSEAEWKKATGQVEKAEAKAEPKKVYWCACGHKSTMPMQTSRGLSCPDCYDRMSE